MSTVLDSTEVSVSDRCLGEIDRRRGLTPKEFMDEYHKPQRPVVLQGLMDDWRATREWSIEWFRDHCGKDEVPVGRCFGEKTKMPFAEYIDYMAEARDERGQGDGKPPLYMEGWYYKNDRPDLADYYRVPEHFGTDWFETGKWPFGMSHWPHGILVGPKGAFTKLHYDLWASHSWNAQVVGRKEWIMIDPSHMKDCYMETRQGGGYVPGTDIENPDLERFPKLANVRYTKTTVNPGEIIWFPTLTLHQVVSLDDTVSITHNYLSGNIYMRVIGRFLASRYFGKVGV